MANMKEIIGLQNICCYSLPNLRLVEWMRSQNHSKADIKALLYTTYIQEKIFLILGKLQIINISTPGIDGRRFLAHILQSMYS